MTIDVQVVLVSRDLYPKCVVVVPLWRVVLYRPLAGGAWWLAAMESMHHNMHNSTV
jgi:hypothetical protein